MGKSGLYVEYIVYFLCYQLHLTYTGIVNINRKPNDTTEIRSGTRHFEMLATGELEIATNYDHRRRRAAKSATPIAGEQLASRSYQH